MGRALSLYTLYQIARISAPTVLEAMVGRARREDHDRRLHDFARRVVDRAGIQLTVIGADEVPLERAFVYMSNHQSHMDIPVLYATVPSPTLRMVAKRELFRIPGFGRAMRAASFIEVDRADRARAVASLKRASELIESGVSVWIAPEGSRTRDGSLGALKKGGFHLARDTGTPIVPVALSGTYRVLPPGSTAIQPGMPVKVVFGAPIPVDGRATSDLIDEVSRFLAAHVEPL
ncbi:MAG TPA: lysophospholipid acyltransferase family protein [Kofleriaceae bacterium]|nr:lysophospholipid acyltransferase family protein [Kofleriaceae bacterium]